MYSAYINRIGKFLPGELINNYEMDRQNGLAPFESQSANSQQQRHSTALLRDR
jgi:hypothetical protein